MKALCWHGKKDVRVDTVPEPKIINEQDAIIRVIATAICGSDIHLYNGFAYYGIRWYFKVMNPNNIPDEQLLFLSDIFPTGYMAAGDREIILVFVQKFDNWDFSIMLYMCYL